MKILMVIPYFITKMGGDVSICAGISKELIKKGHEVTIISSDFGIKNNKLPSVPGANLVFFKSSLRLGLFYYTPSMKKWLKDNMQNFDIIHFHNFRSYQNKVVLNHARKKNKPVVLQPHGSFPKIIEKRLLKNIFDVVWGNEIVNHSSAIIAVSELEKRNFLVSNVQNSKIWVIPNGIDIIKFQSVSRRSDFRELLGIDESKKMVLFIGRLHIIKGIDFLIKAFNQVLQNRNDTVLVIAGPDHGQEMELRSLVNSLGIGANVFFTGHLDDVHNAYVACDLLVYPSRYEIFGLVPLEGIVCGAPVIVTSDCGCGDIIDQANCGLLVKFGDVNDLANKIIKVLDDHDFAIEMVYNGQKYISTNLAWEKIIDQFERVYESCIHNI